MSIFVGWIFFLSLPSAGCQKEVSVAVFSTPDGPQKVILEVANTEEARRQGLMFRTTLQENTGMLFTFEKAGHHPFWMKNTYLSLDILFLSAEGVVVDLFPGLPPCPMDPCPSYVPRAPAKYALEVRAGFAQRHHVRKGDRVRLELAD